MFNPQRLNIARERRAMSKKGVAEKLGVTPNTIHRYETGEITPTNENIQRLAEALNFPSSFFFGSDVDQPRLDNASFRGLASKSARIMNAALASGALAYLFDDWIARRYERAELDLPDFSEAQGMSPATAAKLLRQQWRLGDKPVENMIHLLEAKGIRVFSLAENTKDVDAFSVWRDDIPYVFLNRFKSAERSRFDAAHELCHLCMHKHGGAAAKYTNSPIEKEAQAFAGAFLMPETDLRAIVTSPIYGVDDLLPYKRRWRVAAVALAYRLREIGLIGESRSNSLYVEMSRRGWLKTEPHGISREQSHILQQIMDDLRGLGVTKADISQDTGVPFQEIEAFLFGLANMLTIEGQGARTPPRKVALTLVK
jgi:Zn-dependent peptidase ImmA (M78 family)/transcriptional regulator with XRE-family HTH domain